MLVRPVWSVSNYSLQWNKTYNLKVVIFDFIPSEFFFSLDRSSLGIMHMLHIKEERRRCEETKRDEKEGEGERAEKKREKKTDKERERERERDRERQRERQNERERERERTEETKLNIF